MRCLFLLDHDNIPFGRLNVRDIVAGWIDQMDWTTTQAREPVYADLRAYGGWYQEHDASPARIEAGVMYQRQCPVVIRQGDIICRLAFEFADTLLNLRAHDPRDVGSGHIAYTVTSRTPFTYLQRRAHAPTCDRLDCELNRIERWSKSGRACTHPTCQIELRTQFQRNTQKQVDVHLATDLLIASFQCRYDSVAVASDDWDFLPALLAAATIPNAPMIFAVRFSEKPTYLDSVLRRAGVSICSIAGRQQ